MSGIVLQGEPGNPRESHQTTLASCAEFCENAVFTKRQVAPGATTIQLTQLECPRSTPRIEAMRSLAHPRPNALTASKDALIRGIVIAIAALVSWRVPGFSWSPASVAESEPGGQAGGPPGPFHGITARQKHANCSKTALALHAEKDSKTSKPQPGFLSVR